MRKGLYFNFILTVSLGTTAFGQRARDLGEAARRQHEGVAAGQHDFPNFFTRADVIERVAIGGIDVTGNLSEKVQGLGAGEPRPQ